MKYNPKYFLSVALLCLSLTLFSQTKSSNIQTINGKKYYLHKLDKGQSLYSITKLYNIKLDDLYAENPELKQGTKAGQEIKIPFAGETAHFNNANTTTSTVSTTPRAAYIVDTLKYSTYKVAKGETVYAITKKFNLSADYFEKLNPGSKAGLKEGQLVAIGERSPIKALADATNTVKPIADTFPLKINFPKKNAYNLALILPFKLDQLDLINSSALLKANMSFPQISSLAIDFYLGFKQAVDSLSSKDFKINLELHDLDDKDSLNMVNITSSLDKKQTDFIFGPMYANGFKTISVKAKELNIPIVSPITQQNKFLYENIYASKTNPSQYTMVEALADYILDSLKPKKARVLLNIASEKDAKEIGFAKAFKQYYNEKARKLGYALKDTLSTVRGIAGIKANHEAGIKNVVVSLSSNQILITDFTTQLALFADKKDITLCGFEETSTSFDNIDQEYLNQLNYTFPSANNLTNTKAYQSIISKYWEKQNTYPGKFYFIGFDIGMYYLNNLRDHGADFIFRLNELPSETSYLRFKFTRPDNSTGFDNNGVYIFKYANYQLVETGWK
ncbi:MAG: LysM peptidoglycan-binding domain-containing protein [Bacteroidota bacterium]|nr:LysM peptidoglycan-binding domain-containing protein [Bacteroidota bacterium]